MVTIGLTTDADHIINELKDHFGFGSSSDMALFAFSYAVRNNLPRVPISGTQTKWGTSTFNVTDFEMIINICYPDNEEDLVTVFRDLIHAGIFKINEIMRDNPDLKISDIIS